MDKLIKWKTLTPEQIDKEWDKLYKHDATRNSTSWIGNPLLYHYFMYEYCSTHTRNKPSLVEIYNDPEKLRYLQNQVRVRKTAEHNKLTQEELEFYVWRLNSGGIYLFKPACAMFMYNKYGATSILDPTAGWGGRGLGAVALGLKYTGIDTNINLREGYNKLFGDKITMIWEDCLSVDFSKIYYDFVLTSPPYEDHEIYSHYEYNYNNFYTEFLIPLINKCRKHNKGLTAFNISPQMYKKLIKNGYEEAHLTEELKEQTNKKRNKNDLIYLWR